VSWLIFDIVNILTKISNATEFFLKFIKRAFPDKKMTFHL